MRITKNTPPEKKKNAKTLMQGKKKTGFLWGSPSSFVAGGRQVRE